MSELHVLRVYTTPASAHGNRQGVFMHGGAAPEAQRPAVAADLSFSETAFLDNAERAEFLIFTPTLVLPFAGHPSVGAAWLIRDNQGKIAVLRPPAGDLRVRYEAELV